MYICITCVAGIVCRPSKTAPSTETVRGLFDLFGRQTETSRFHGAQRPSTGGAPRVQRSIGPSSSQSKRLAAAAAGGGGDARGDGRYIGS